MILLALACTPQVFAPDFAGCTVTNEIDEFADGSVDSTQVSRIDDQGRTAHIAYTAEGYDYELTSTFSGDCETERVTTAIYADGTVYEERIERDCDDGGDPIEELRVTEQSGDRPYTFRLRSTWDRTYDDGGRTIEAFRLDDYLGQGFESESYETYDYDVEGRLVRFLTEGQYASELRTWVYAEDLEDGVVATETRNGFGNLVEGEYTTYDERGRPIETRSLDEERNETVVTRTWEKKRWADTGLVASVPDGDGYEATITCNDEDPYTERRVEYDGWLDARDGQPDYVQVQRVECGG